MKRILLVLLIAIAGNVPARAQAHPTLLTIDAKGEKLRNFYERLNVESLWIAGHHVNWETGVPDSPNAVYNIRGHSGLFAASACKKLKIYLLHPPEHGQDLLTYAQADWLATKAANDKGWQKISGDRPYQKAQEYANKGLVVLAVYKNSDKYKPGHMALIMPEEIMIKTINESGPRVIQAGKNNYHSVSLLQGFNNHISVWPSAEVMFYYNAAIPF